MSYFLKHVISSAIKYGFIKRQDRRLLKEFSEKYKPFNAPPIFNSALFYPSAGLDLIIPLILGLPYCRDFYFYEWEPKFYIDDIEKIHCFFPTLNGITVIKTDQFDWIVENEKRLISFKHNSIERTIHWVHKDNKDFLTRNVNLAFYFHRGDSYGEGGSGQFWDSDLLPELMKKVPNDYRCLFVTDGEPRGLLESVKEKAHEFKIHENMGRYYFGILPSQLQYSCINN